MTWVDAVDDAIKIGLGALIVIFGQALAHKRDWRREYGKRRLELIEKAAEEFAAADHLMARFVIDVRLRIEHLEKTPDAKQTIQAREKLSSAKGKLALMGCDNSVAKLNTYVDTLTTVLEAVYPEMILHQLDEAWMRAAAKRNELYKALQGDYQTALEKKV